MKQSMLQAAIKALAFGPWVAAMYLLYWFESQAIWVPETLHRDKLTIMILVTGMAGSFFLYRWLSKRSSA